MVLSLCGCEVHLTSHSCYIFEATVRKSLYLCLVSPHWELDDSADVFVQQVQGPQPVLEQWKGGGK